MVQIVSKEEFEKIPGEVMWTNVCRVKGGMESGKMDKSRKPGAQAFFAAGVDKTIQNEAVSLELIDVLQRNCKPRLHGHSRRFQQVFWKAEFSPSKCLTKLWAGKTEGSSFPVTDV